MSKRERELFAAGAEADEAYIVGGLEADESYDESWRKVLERVTGEERRGRFDDWLQWRLAQAGLNSEQEWLDELLHSDNPVLVVQSLQGTLLQTQGPPVHISGHFDLSSEQLEKLAQCDGSHGAVRAILRTGAMILNACSPGSSGILTSDPT